ncbi:hypothetical protein B9Z19DRAFT_241135 [Tuber borchii]|uniref:Uncharacterized protein n=1 Tax=Tuber borchii TaxID=42251 RepID=A0A2T6ZMB1_TUBBO|nr:hypothetical protein B9Z19DRAFT_241135 [Tuber borchii]
MYFSRIVTRIYPFHETLLNSTRPQAIGQCSPGSIVIELDRIKASVPPLVLVITVQFSPHYSHDHHHSWWFIPGKGNINKICSKRKPTHREIFE